jgi:hypothetical protein
VHARASLALILLDPAVEAIEVRAAARPAPAGDLIGDLGDG